MVGGSGGASDGSGGIALKVFADDDAQKAGTPGPRGLFIELERREGKRFTPVFRSLEPAWSVMGLPPGEYRLRFPARLDETGNAVTLDEDPRTVKVKAGEVTEVDTVLEHVDEGLIVAGVIAAVALAVFLDGATDQVAYCLGAVAVTACGNQLVKLPCQSIVKRNRETFHTTFPLKNAVNRATAKSLLADV